MTFLKDNAELIFSTIIYNWAIIINAYCTGMYVTFYLHKCLNGECQLMRLWIVKRRLIELFSDLFSASKSIFQECVSSLALPVSKNTHTEWMNTSCASIVGCVTVCRRHQKTDSPLLRLLRLALPPVSNIFKLFLNMTAADALDVTTEKSVGKEHRIAS